MATGGRLARRLFPDKDQDSGDQGEDGKQDAGGTEAEAGNAHDADENEVDSEQEHADVFGDHGGDVDGSGAIVTRQ